MDVFFGIVWLILTGLWVKDRRFWIAVPHGMIAAIYFTMAFIKPETEAPKQTVPNCTESAPTLPTLPIHPA